MQKLEAQRCQANLVTQLVGGQPELNIKSFECWVHDLPAAFYWLPVILTLFFPCLNNLSFQLILTSVCIFSTSSLFLPPSHIYITCSLKQPTHLWPPQHRSLLDQWDHIIESPSLPFMPLVLLYALIPQSFEPQHTRWYGKEDNSCLPWERTSNLRCPELRFLARVLFSPKAPPRCWKFFNAFKAQC